MLVDSNLESNLIADLMINNEIYENIGFKIKISDETYEVNDVIRPPSSSLSDLNTNFFPFD